MPEPRISFGAVVLPPTIVPPTRSVAAPVWTTIKSACDWCTSNGPFPFAMGDLHHMVAERAERLANEFGFVHLRRQCLLVSFKVGPLPDRETAWIGGN